MTRTPEATTAGPGGGPEAPDRSVVAECAIYLSRITDLPFREAVHWKRVEAWAGGHSPADPTPESCPDLADLLAHTRASGVPLRIYYGNEFCEHRISGRREFAAACAAVESVGLPLTVVTPPVSEAGAEVLATRLAELARLLPGSEVVVNDWGVLRLLRREFPGLEPVLGRLMTRFLRDPRVTPRLGLGAAGASPHPLRQASVGMPAFRRMLEGHGIRRIELDNLYQGIDLDFRSLRLLPSLYLPYGYVTTGRICQQGNEHLPRDRKFGTPPGSCPLPCLRVEIGLKDRNARADGGQYSFTQRGNTIFYRQPPALMASGRAWAEERGARLVYQPEIPF
jgi:hypothetical protein